MQTHPVASIAALLAMTVAAAPAFAQADPALAALVPASVTERGYVTIAELSDYPPMSSLNGDAVEGLGPDLTRAIGEVLGVETRIVATTFDTMLPGMASGRYDLAHGYFYVTPERLNVVDFVTDFRDRDSFVAGPEAIIDPAQQDNLCGLRIAVMSAGPQLVYAEQVAAQCKEKGLPEVTVMGFAQQVPALMAVSSSRADLSIGNMAVVEQIMSEGTTLKVVGEYGGGLNGIAFQKDEDARALQTAWQAAINSLIASGRYEEILQKWNTTYGAIPASEIYRTEADLKGQERAGI